MKLELRGYQQEGLARIAEAESRGVRRQLGVAATGLGKAQPVDEPVLTPSGWRPIGDLSPGDLVIGATGHPTTVTGVYPQGRRPVVRVMFSDGAAVRCDEDHLWAVRDKYDVLRGRPWRVLRASELGGRRWRVPMVEPVEQDEWPLPLDPYLLGVLLGDGGLSVRGRVLLHTEHALAATLELPAPATMTRLRDDGPNGIGGTYIIGGPIGRGANPVLTAVRQLGLEGSHAADKRVPWAYMHAGPSARLDLLRGLMDADGHARPDGYVELTLANEGLVDDAAALVRSLGGTARKATKVTRWTYLGVAKAGVAWRLSIAMTQCPFRWKAPRWRPRTKYPPARHIEAVEPWGVAECVCIAVDAPDHLYVTTDYVVTHNTVMFCALAEQRGGRTLILAHRDELISQAAAKVREVWPEARVGVVKAQENDVRADVVVASVQTLARSRRLAQLVAPFTEEGFTLAGRAEPFGLVVVDEAHHAAAESYRGILDTLGCNTDDGPLLLGVTATPDRGDGKGLDDLFDEIVFSYDILWGIRQGYLSDLRGVRIRLSDFDLGDVKVSRGDYEAGAAGRALEDAQAPHFIAEAWLAEHVLPDGSTVSALDRPTLVFTPTVALAVEVAAEFAGRGIRSAWVSGETPLDERRKILADFAAGQITVVANCAVLTEGFDAPHVSCIVQARPTRSRALYTQMVGRGTRRYPEKADCLVLDVVGSSDDLSLVTIPSLFGIDQKLRPYRDGESMAAAAEDHARELVRLGRITAEEAELFAQVRAEGVAWVAVHQTGQLRRYERSLAGDLPTVVLQQRVVGEDVWTAGLWVTPRRDRAESKRVLMANVPLELAQGVAEDFIRKNDTRSIAASDAAWRSRKPTPKAKAAAAKWQLKVDKGWSAGELSDALDAHIARIRSQPRKVKP